MKYYIVGAGCGDPGLITVKGMELLQTAMSYHLGPIGPYFIAVILFLLLIILIVLEVFML